MLLTLSTTMPQATDLGFLLHKHPDRAQAFHRVVQNAQEQRLRRRLAVVERRSGALTDVYEDDYLERLRKEWPD